jgi:hypothetical protein
MGKFKTGDIFTFRLTDDEYLTGRIVLDIQRQCARPRLIKPGSPLASHNPSLLVEIYRSTSRAPTASRAEVLIPCIFVGTESLKSGDWSIVGREDIDPTRVEFPENLIGRGVRSAFVKGEIRAPIELELSDLRRISSYPSVWPSRVLKQICLYKLGRKEEIDKTRFRNLEVFNPQRYDLRFSEYRSEFYRMIGELEDQSYYEMSLRFGRDLKRFYQSKKRSPDSSREFDNSGIFDLCPYCVSPILENTRDCPRCGEDTTQDARIESDERQYFAAERVKCKSCGGVMLKLAVICPLCREPQREYCL